MQPEKESNVKAGQTGEAADTPAACPSCHARLVPGMRFCRTCGYRLGEGVEEYAETRRFSGDIPFVPPAGTTTDARKGASPNFMPGTWAPLAPLGARNSSLADSAESKSTLAKTWRRLRGNWMVWVLVIIVVLTASGVVMRNVRRAGGLGGAPTVAAPASFLGVDGLDDADGGGAFIEGIAAPGTPVELAGLIGGDVITSFDGQQVRDDSEMRRILRQTPPGKTVEVIYIRDGETRTTMLTTIAEKDYRGLQDLDARPEGRGFLGIGGMDRVRVPNTNSYGVEVDVSSNRPADIAGMRDGDIIVEFGGKPIRTEGDLRLRIYEAVPGTTIQVVVVRAGERVTIPVKMGRDD
ncbi:MAG TPA: PDZ domain-containing protein [Pyrinomonadaceae bacterium]|nr:PDZ domain-containing protein [Pyrinomonadaceae bacterium]